MNWNEIKQKINREEIYVSKKRSYPNRFKIGIVTTFAGFLLAVCSYPIIHNLWVTVIGLGIMMLGVAIFTIMSEKSIFWADIVVKDGSIFYKLPKHETLFETFADVESFVEEGPDHDKYEP